MKLKDTAGKYFEFVRTGNDPWNDSEGFLEWLDGWEPEKFYLIRTKMFFDANWHVPAAGEEPLTEDDVRALTEDRFDKPESNLDQLLEVPAADER